MPKKNRVTPLGEIIATSARGTLMGNRGCLHDAQGNIVRSWARKAWVTCLLQYNDRHRTLMAPGQYTELFFLDEATALAAGHRHCGTCQKQRYELFKRIWAEANTAEQMAPDSSIAAIDTALHRARAASSGSQVAFTAPISQLPQGCFVARQSDMQSPLLWWNQVLHPWTPSGYLPGEAATEQESVSVMTPTPIVRMLSQGYLPQVHVSAAPMEALSAPIVHAREQRSNESLSQVIDRSALVGSKGKLHQKETTVQTTLYKLKKTPGGKALYAYFAAILRVTGMDQGQAYPLKRFLRNFSGHLNAGRIEVASGGYRLTRSGLDYFLDRYNTGNPQHIAESDVRTYEQGIRNGGRDWETVK